MPCAGTLRARSTAGETGALRRVAVGVAHTLLDTELNLLAVDDDVASLVVTLPRPDGDAGGLKRLQQRVENPESAFVCLWADMNIKRVAEIHHAAGKVVKLSTLPTEGR